MSHRSTAHIQPEFDRTAPSGGDGDVGSEPSRPRRRLLGLGLGAALVSGLPLMAGCGTPLPLDAPSPPRLRSGARDAEALLLRSAEVHGLAAYRRLHDINIAYDGRWRPLIDRIQPLVVAPEWRGSSEERLLPRAAINAQSYRGSAGNKFVHWQRGSDAAPGRVAVWFNGQPARDPRVLAASAVVAECYGLFLLGPLWLADRSLAMQRAGNERVHGRLCDVVDVWLRPGLGLSALDRVAVCIDRDDAVTRRVRFTLEGFEDTQGAVAEVDTFEHQRRHGVLWPMRSYEAVVHPLRLPAHDWHITGLDVDRGYDAAALSGPGFGGSAAAPATPV